MLNLKKKIAHIFGIWFEVFAILITRNSTLALDYRLSQSVVPLDYDIYIKPFLPPQANSAKEFTFDGEVRITLQSKVPLLKTITLHAAYLKFSNVELFDPRNNSTENVPLSALSYENETDKLTIPLTKDLIPFTNYTLYFKYTGLIRNGTSGLFPVSYKDSSGKIVLVQKYN